jgi:predicted nuclease with TOPRIM domain
MDIINKQKPKPSNYTEWREQINEMTLETHNSELLNMKLPSNYKTWRQRIDEMTLDTHDPELFSMKY